MNHWTFLHRLFDERVLYGAFDTLPSRVMAGPISDKVKACITMHRTQQRTGNDCEISASFLFRGRAPTDWFPVHVVLSPLWDRKRLTIEGIISREPGTELARIPREFVEPTEDAVSAAINKVVSEMVAWFTETLAAPGDASEAQAPVEGQDAARD